MTATKTSMRLAQRRLYLVINLHLKRLCCEEKFRCRAQFFAKYFDVGVKKTKQKKNSTSNWCGSPSSLFGTFSHCLVFLSHQDVIDCEHMNSYNTKRRECMVSALRFGFMFGITRSLFTARSALAYTRTNLWRSGVGSSSLLMTAPRWPLQRKQMEPQGDVSISLTTWVSQGKEQM